MKEDMVIMKKAELKRLYIIQKVNEKQIKQKEASKLINLSERQVRRIQKRVKEKGSKGVIHQLRKRK